MEERGNDKRRNGRIKHGRKAWVKEGRKARRKCSEGRKVLKMELNKKDREEGNKILGKHWMKEWRTKNCNDGMEWRNEEKKKRKTIEEKEKKMSENEERKSVKQHEIKKILEKGKEKKA